MAGKEINKENTKNKNKKSKGNRERTAKRPSRNDRGYMGDARSFEFDRLPWLSYLFFCPDVMVSGLRAIWGLGAPFALMGFSLHGYPSDVLLGLIAPWFPASLSSGFLLPNRWSPFCTTFPFLSGLGHVLPIILRLPGFTVR